MALIIETGAGTPGANSYVPEAFVTAYLAERGRSTENGWDVATSADREANCIAATEYADKRFGSRVGGRVLVASMPGRASSGTITFAVNPSDLDTVTIGAIVYRFVAALAQGGDVLIGATLDDSLDNLVAALGLAAGIGDTYHAETLSNPVAWAGADTGVLTVASVVEGELGDTIALAASAATASGATLTGGIDTGPQPRVFPRASLYVSGAAVVGVPLPWRQAVAEYAVRASTGALAPDQELSATGIPVQSTFEKVGPLEERTVFVEGAQPRTFRPYPAADELVSQYLTGGGPGSAGSFR